MKALTNLSQTHPQPTPEPWVTIAKTFHPLAARGLERSSRLGAACLALGRGRLRVLVTLGALLLLWRGLTGALGPGAGMRFPGPAHPVAAGQQILFDGYGSALWHEHALRSVRLVGLGFVVAATPGVLLGLAMGASRTVEALVNPVFLLLRPIPPLAWIPLAIVWLGLGDAAKVMVIF